MSLNGLDSAAVAEALQAAQADAGGWFLLKYVSRDTVELLARGSGGVPEVQKVIEGYEEKSPLYGLVQYRRKKVILKYVPDGTSRLLQVRLTVQFQSVLDTFTPHDTVFSFTAASELTESALGLSSMLFPHAPSLTSSTSSLRRRRLNGISEDVEENVSTVKEETKEDAEKDGLTINFAEPIAPESLTLSLEPTPAPTYGRHELDELPASAVLAKALLAKRKEEARAATPTSIPSINFESPETDKVVHPPRKESLLSSPILGSASPLHSPVPPSIRDKDLPASPEPIPSSTSEAAAAEAPDFEAASNILLGTTTPAAADHSEPTSSLLHTRHLSAAESDSISQWSSNVTSYATAPTKKQKRAPRPHIDSSDRPKTSGTTNSNISTRPVANLPNSIRVKSNRPLGGLNLRPGSQQSTRSVPGRFAPVGHSLNGAPPLPSPAFLSPLHSPASNGSAMLRPSSVTTETSATTPEKLRLMKALQLRKRNMLLTQRASSTASAVTPDSRIQHASSSSTSTTASNPHQTTSHGHDPLGNIDEESRPTNSSYTNSPTVATIISEEPSTKASSFSEHGETTRSQRSLSSATSSSLTPKAPLQENMLAKDVAPSTNNAQPKIDAPTRPTGPTHDSQSDLKAAMAYLESASGNDDLQQQAPLPGTAKQPHSVAEAPTHKRVSSKSKRELPTPLKIVPMNNISTSDVSDDDSLMDEIQNATVHEAKPISVARTPVTPIVSKSSSDRLREMTSQTTRLPSSSRSVGRQSNATTPVRGRSTSGSTRSISTALPHWPPLPTDTANTDQPLTKKGTIGTGISKRIKALEISRTKTSSPPRQPEPVRATSAGTSAFSAFMKRSSLLGGPHPFPNTSTDDSSPQSLPRTTSYADQPPRPTTRGSTRTSSEAQRAGPKGESISVTARIVREPGTKHPPLAPSSSYHTPLNLHRSPLIVEHGKHQKQNSEANIPLEPARVKSPTKSDKGGRFSFSSHRSASHPNLPRSESSQSKFSKASKRRGPRSISDATSINEEKGKSSMTSRLMKRVSNLAGSRNKAPELTREDVLASQVDATEEPSRTDRYNSVAESLMHVVDIGEANVQFPESLLWKRRFMRVDDQGYLIFSPPATESTSRSSSRKFHLGDFRRPALPDYERQEMAWSILLDLKDGRCVQCACESRQTQQQVLQMLVDAHSAYHQLYGA